MNSLEVLLSPAEFVALKDRDLRETTCVVFDVLRATTSMVTALANGAEAIVPVSEIAEAIRLRESRPEALLAGERDGLRITTSLTGGLDFDLGNSPREFTQSLVEGKTIIMTTTNGTRALRACAHARHVLVGCFLNLQETANWLLALDPQDVLLICSGTFEQAAYEDVLAAGAMCDLIWPADSNALIADSALMARDLFRFEKNDLFEALARSRNGLRLRSRPELRDDVAFSAQLNSKSIAAGLDRDGAVRRVDQNFSFKKSLSV